MKALTVAARAEELYTVLDFIHGELEPWGCSMRMLFQLDLAVEELFVNIANYAYAPGTGEVEVLCQVAGEPPQVTISLVDGGMPFDPLAREDADISPEALKRREGGLGILLVKKNMDAVSYAYENGKNRLTLCKTVEPE